MQKIKNICIANAKIEKICIANAKNKRNLHCQCKKYEKICIADAKIKKLALPMQKTHQIDDLN